MSRRLKQLAVVFIIVFAAAQLVRPARANPATDPSHTIEAVLGPESALPPILDRACGDCHANNTTSSWYTRVAPLSWLMARSVAEGRRVVNFSEWSGYPPEVQDALLSASCAAATSGKMPGPYVVFRPAAKLSPRDIETICAAAGQR